MTVSIFSTIAAYARSVFRGMRSIWGSIATALPYLIVFKSGEHRKEVTEQYPDPVSSRTADDLPPRTRGLLQNDIERCTGCRDCEKACPVSCISIENEQGPDALKTWVSVFDIDFSRCTFCGICVEVCGPQSLTHTKRYEGAVYALPDLVATYGKGRVTPEQRAKWAMLRQQQESEGLTL